MKFIIARSTALAITSTVNEVNALGGKESNASAALLQTASALNQLKNFEVSFPGHDIQLEVNDEIVLRYLALYIKTLKLVTPMVTAVIGMWNAVQGLIKTDCEELIAFIKARKE